jgi:hypothetical protein
LPLLSLRDHGEFLADKAPVNSRPFFLSALLLALVALQACAPAKDLSPKEIALSTEAPANPLSPAGVEKMTSLLQLYAPAAGMNKKEIHLFFGRFQPEMQSLADALLPADESRYVPAVLVEKLSQEFPPLAWAKAGPISSPADMHATLARLHPGAPAAALEEISLRLSADPGHRGLIKAGLIMAALKKIPEAAIQRAKIRALFEASAEGWEDAFAASMLLNALEKDSRFPKARALHQSLWSQFPRQKLVEVSAVEAFDWWLDIRLAEKSALPGLMIYLPKAKAKILESMNGSAEEQIFDWQIAGLTNALYERCQLEVGEVYAKEDIQAALYRVNVKSRGDEARICSEAEAAFQASAIQRGIWRMRARFGS